MTNLEKQKLEREEKAQKIIEKIRPQIDEKLKNIKEESQNTNLIKAKNLCLIFS